MERGSGRISLLTVYGSEMRARGNVRLTGSDCILDSADDFPALFDVFRVFQAAFLTSRSTFDGGGGDGRSTLGSRSGPTRAVGGCGRTGARFDAGLAFEALDLGVEVVETLLLRLGFGGEAIRLCFEEGGEPVEEGVSRRSRGKGEVRQTFGLP